MFCSVKQADAVQQLLNEVKIADPTRTNYPSMQTGDADLLYSKYTLANLLAFLQEEDIDVVLIQELRMKGTGIIKGL